MAGGFLTTPRRRVENPSSIGTQGLLGLLKYGKATSRATIDSTSHKFGICTALGKMPCSFGRFGTTSGG